MNVLQIVPELNAGGVERTALEAAEMLVANGHGAHVLSNGGRLVPELEAMGGVHHTADIGSKNIISVPWRIAGVRRLIVAQKIDIVHVRSRAPAWPAIYAARAQHVPFVTTYHGIYNAKSALKRGYNSVMAKGDVVIANSNFTSEHIIREHGTEPNKIVVIPRGVDMTLFDPARMSSEAAKARRESWGVPKDATLILLPGRLTGWKGQRVAIAALADLPPAYHLVLLGDAQGRDGYVAELMALAAELGLSDRVHIPGHDADVATAYLAADIVICPSTDPEAFGRTAAEAQAMGRPVIASDHGGAVEVVAHGVTGWRFEPGNATALATAVKTVDHLTGVAGARARVAAQFSKAALQSALLDVYQGLVKPPRI